MKIDVCLGGDPRSIRLKQTGMASMVSESLPKKGNKCNVFQELGSKVCQKINTELKQIST